MALRPYAAFRSNLKHMVMFYSGHLDFTGKGRHTLAEAVLVPRDELVTYRVRTSLYSLSLHPDLPRVIDCRADGLAGTPQHYPVGLPDAGP